MSGKLSERVMDRWNVGAHLSPIHALVDLCEITVDEYTDKNWKKRV